MEKNIICEFCKSKFKTVNNLNTHCKTAKYCIEIQKKEKNFTNDELKKCPHCLKTFAGYLLNRHFKSCKNKKEKDTENKDSEIEILKLQIQNMKEEKDKEIQLLKKKYNKQIKFLKDEITKLEVELKIKNEIFEAEHECIIDLAKQPKNITSNTQNNKTLNITTPCIDFNDINKIEDLIDEYFNIEYALEGQKGFAQFAVDKLLKDKDGNLTYICSDPSRYIFKYLDKNGELRKDIDAKKLTESLLQGGIKRKHVEKTIGWYTDDDGGIDIEKQGIIFNIAEPTLSIKEDNNIFKKEIAALTSM